MSLHKIFPFLLWLPLTKKTWKDDLIAGITGTIIVIPQAVAFAMIAGLPPIYGFYTAMITPIIAALFGSSYHLISGPTTTTPFPSKIFTLNTGPYFLYCSCANGTGSLRYCMLWPIKGRPKFPGI